MRKFVLLGPFPATTAANALPAPQNTVTALLDAAKAAKP